MHISLQTSLHNAAVLYLAYSSQLTSGAATARDNTKQFTDVAIIGGGPSGTYAAWRLATSDLGDKTITLYESTDRIGGRLYSPLLAPDTCGENDSSPRGELGGMRIRQGKNVDPVINNLVKQLNIETGLFAMNAEDKSAKDDINNFRRLRGFTYKNSDLQDPEAMNSLPFPYYIHSNTESILVTPEEANNQTVNPIWLDDMTFGGSDNSEREVGSDATICDSVYNRKMMEQTIAGSDPLYEYSYMGFSMEVLNQTLEDFNMRTDISGYRGGGDANFLSDNSIQIAGNLSLTGYVRPLMGMQHIPETLAQKFVEAVGRNGDGDSDDTPIRMNKQLTRVERADDAKYRLTFSQTRTNLCTGQTVETGEVEHVYTDRVILAMPKAPLSKIDMALHNSNSKEDKQARSDHWNTLVNSVDGVTAAKIIPGWNKPWWKEAHPDFKAGRQITSDPLKQVYSWYPGTQELTSTCESEPEYSVLQIYPSGSTNNMYWRSLMMEALTPATCPSDVTLDQCGSDLCFPASQFVGDPKNRLSKRLNTAIKSQLATMFEVPMEAIPDPDTIQHHLWDGDSELTKTFAWHNWRTSQKFWEIYQEMLEPFGKDEQIHVVGEAYSMNQGWTEGALQTVENLMQNVLGLASVEGLTKKQLCYANPFWLDE